MGAMTWPGMSGSGVQTGMKKNKDLRVLRGGSWHNEPVYLRVSYRAGTVPTSGATTSVSVSSRTFRNPVPLVRCASCS